MNFKAVDMWAAQSDCGRYFVEMASVEGRFKHTAWFKQDDKTRAKLLGTRDTKPDAVRICEEHARSHP